ncbi:MAG: hypothetical protein KAS32_08755 [Candidatus Peribacteraceae bacterium]|nr:hypothetical protein [Candidatus Peribacteraceae bacterium]
MSKTFSSHRIIFVLLVVLFVFSGVILINKFYKENTIIVPAQGGTYIEGSVGQLSPLLPWFTVRNDVNRDIVSLVFSGLQKYNPATGKIENDLAELTVSKDNRMYTVKLKENLYWHDSTPEFPHKVTVDDILYTFNTLQDAEFPNTLLRQNFLGVTIDKLSEREVRFTLEEPYRYFASNLTLGLIPESSLEGIPINKLNQALDFGFSPIGAGPYKFRSIAQTELSTEITLERFDRPVEDEYHLKRVIFRIFPDYTTLLSDIRNLDAVRLVPRNDQGDPLVPRSFTAVNYTLPQYVALFFNLDTDILKDLKLRLGLQLGTNKDQIVKTIQESIIVDTPLLEIDTTDWRYKFDTHAAQGAFFSSDWNLPQKVRLQRLLEIREANNIGVLKTDSVVLLDTGASLLLTGSVLHIDNGATLNGIPVQIQESNTGSWIAALPTNNQTGSLVHGFNHIQLKNLDGSIVDSMYLLRTTATSEYKRAIQEQDIVDRFLASRDGSIPFEERISVSNLYLEKGMIRIRLSTDPYDIRINNKGEKLNLRLLTSNTPSVYKSVAEEIKKQWEPLGVHVGIEIPETRSKFEEKLINRDYDILLFGQSLLDNLDSYSYWHSSGIQQFTGKRSDLRIDAYNLSQYPSLEADSLLELIRKTADEEELDLSLNELNEVLKKDVPAIFLYSPLYTYAFVKDLHGMEIGKPSLHSDRFLTLHKWYLKEERQFKAGKGWLSFIPWLFSLI